MEISENSDFLYFTNLYDQKLYKLDITGATPTLAASYNIPAVCTDGNSRPYGLKVKNGKVYVGVVCDGASSQNPSDMRAYVYALDESLGTFSTVFDFPLTYPKGYPTINTPSVTNWRPWTDDFSTITRSNDDAAYPQPILTDIELDLDGSLILGFGDRSGMQLGWFNYALSGTTTYKINSGGDLLRAALKDGVYVLENNAYVLGLTGSSPNNTQGPGFGEFYYDNFYFNASYPKAHTEIAMGALALLPGSGQTIFTTMDPIDGSAYAGGFRYISNTTGLSPSGNARGAQVYYSGNGPSSTFGKSVGLGDMELNCADITYLQIGNYAWIDTDQDGIQDACETPLSGVKVALYKDVSGTLTYLANTTTGANGEYYFTGLGAAGENWTATSGYDSLTANTTYKVVFGWDGTTSQFNAGFLTIGATNYQLTDADSGEGTNADLNDSDASLMTVAGNSYPSISLTTGEAGSVNHTFDAGFVCAEIAITLSQTAPTCTGSTPNNDGSITLTAITNADKFGVSSGATYSGTPAYAAATAIGALPMDLQTAIPNTGGTYTIRFFNGSDGCFKDSTVTVAVVSCATSATCNCTEYIYLNEPSIGSVLKFEVGAGLLLTEVMGANGAGHWYPGTGASVLPAPHGLATDLNGNLYIGSSVNAGFPIREFNCDGVISPTGPETINSAGALYNMFSIGNTIYTTALSSTRAYNSCTGAFLGSICYLDKDGNPVPTSDIQANRHWGLSYNETTEMVYDVHRGGIARGVYAFTRMQLEAGIAGGPCISPLIAIGTSATINPGDNFIPSNISELLGIVSDNSGNIYVIGWAGGGGAVRILKYDAAGGFIAMSSLNPAMQSTHGIVWSEVTNRLYVSNLTDNTAFDCISAYDPTTMAYLGAAAVNPNLPTNNSAKALAIIKECCPTNLPTSFNVNVCGGVGQKFYLNQEAFNSMTCGEGIVCGSSWVPQGGGTGMTFDACDNSVTITGAGCMSFALNINAVSSTGCPAQNATFTICNTIPPIATLSQTAPTCTGVTPNNDGKITLTAITNADKFGVSTGATYSGTPAYAAATAIGALPMDLQTAIPNTGGTYTIRFFNGSDDCYKDTTVTVAAVCCSSTGTESYAGCSGDGYSVTVDGMVYNESNPTGTEVLTNWLGCDSTVTVSLVFHPQPALATTDAYQCAGSSTDLSLLVSNSGGGPVDTAYFSTLSDALANTSPLASSTVTPASATMYYVRMASQASAACFDVDSILVTPREITVRTMQECQQNGTPSNPADDYFTLEVLATATGAGASNQYEVVLGANPDGTGGTVLGTQTYGSPISVGNGVNGATGTFVADGSTTYAITVRDANGAACAEMLTTSPVNECAYACDPQCLLDWDNNAWASGSMSNTYTVSGTTVTIDFDDASGSLSTAPPVNMPVAAPFYQGDQPGVGASLLSSVDLIDFGTANTLEIGMSLGYPGLGVDDLNFKIFDVDGEINALFRQEKFVITGYLNGVAVNPVLTGSFVHTISGNEVLGWTPTSPTGGNSADGVVSVYFADPVDSVAVIFSINPGSVVNPTSKPGFGIFDLAFCANPFVEEPAIAIATDSICSGDDPGVISLTATLEGSGPISYQWQFSTVGCGSGFADILGANADSYDPPAGLTVTTYYRLIAATSSAACATVFSDTSNCITVTVLPLPDFTLALATVCPGDSPEVTIGGLTGGTPATSTMKINTGSFVPYVASPPNLTTAQGIVPNTTNTVTVQNEHGCEATENIAVPNTIPKVCPPVILTRIPAGSN